MVRKSKIVSGLKEAVRFARGDGTAARKRVVHGEQPIDVRAIRKKQGLSQREFAEKYGFPIATLRNWEQGHRVPTGASRNFLIVIDRAPSVVEQALAA